MMFKKLRAMAMAAAIAFTSVASVAWIPGNVQIAEASTGLDMNGNTIRGYAFSDSNFPVYNRTDSSKQKIGTCYGSSDLIIIHGVGSDGWADIEYPVKGGTKRGYCLISYLFADPDFAGVPGIVQNNMNTYRKVDCYIKYGTTTKNDRIFITGYSNGNTQIFYPCKGYYKTGWIKGTYSISDGCVVQGGGNGDSVVNNEDTYSISGDLLTVNGVDLTEYRIGSRYTSSRYANVNGKSVDMYGWQCCGFARYVLQKLYGCHDKNAPGKFSDVSGVVSAADLSADKIKSVVMSAGVGAHIRTNGSNHSMVIIGITNDNFTIVDANSDGRNTIRVKTYTWSEYANGKYGRRGLLYVKKYIG